ncbi:DMT family transporter [Marivita sp. S2033]|uniref:DMT family transporter n=1 Tax=Marivita sp. S2033 TaxID=3373187 RepID=UPI00398286FC
MTLTIFFAVLLAALLHAIWNAMVKGGPDKDLAMTAVILGSGIIGLFALLFVPAPDPASLPLMAASLALHIGYQFFLLASYRVGDLTQVYPLARGSAPLIVAVVSILFLGETLTPGQLAAIALIGLGIMSITFSRRRHIAPNYRATALALVTGGFIAAYSLVDGWGARQAGTALGFYGSVAAANGLIFTTIVAIRRPSVLRQLPTQGLKALTLGGVASFTAYALVVWAFTHAPIALVTALRETSIIFAMLIGVLVLRETLNPIRGLAALLTLAGVILLRITS